MKASKFVGNPQVEWTAVSRTTIANSRMLSADLPLVHIVVPGMTWFGEDYFNLFLDLVGIVDLHSEFPSGPILQFGPIHIRLLNQRYYYFSDTVLNQGLTAPIKLDLLSPCIPFLEMKWNPTDGLSESLEGLQHFDPTNFVRDGDAFLKQVGRLLRPRKKRGRPRVYSTKEEYNCAMRRVKEQLTARGEPITQEAAGHLLEHDPRMIREWNEDFDTPWNDIKHGD